MTNYAYVTEYSQTVPQQAGSAIPIVDSAPITVQKLDITSGHAESAAFNAKTRIIRITADAAWNYLVSSGGTAATTSNGSRLAAGAVEYLGVPLGRSYIISGVLNP
jgi:hypothetical protein